MRKLSVLWLLVHAVCWLSAQDSSLGYGTVKGIITDQLSHEPVIGAVLSINEKYITETNEVGFFLLDSLPMGSFRIKITSHEYITKDTNIVLSANQPNVDLTYIMIETDHTLVSKLRDVHIFHKSESQEIKESGYSVNVVETERFSKQSVDLNSLLDHTAGVRVMRTGGMGADFNYSLNGMSGKSIRFLIDGIPITYYGSVYDINNLPVSQVERVEVYKGVVPVSLASDALGGAVNIVTKNNRHKFLEASYSYGSFNSHQAALQGQWIGKKSKIVTRLSSFYNRSDNNYKVWGKTVTYYDESTNYRPIEFTKETPATRFNDDYRSFLIKSDIGVINKKIADKLFLGFLASDVDKGVQHGQTMAYVYGDMRYRERLYMPNLTYQKNDFLLKRLNIKLYSSYAFTKAISIDTSTSNYNWNGDVVSVDLDGGERRNQRSLFYLMDKAIMSNTKSNYFINNMFDVDFNVLINSVKRTGNDDFTPYHTVPFTKPQSLKTVFNGLSFNSKLMRDRLKTSLFIKDYHYVAFITDESAARIKNRKNKIGGGVSSSVKLFKNNILKMSLERTVRLPDTREALGNGVNILNSPTIQPESSVNLNLGFLSKKIILYGKNSIKVGVNAFFRETSDLIYPTITGGRGEITYLNIGQVRGKGVEVDVNYGYNSKIKFNYNITYLDQRNNQRVTENGIKNILYKDRLRNAPYLMANTDVNYTLENLILKYSKSFIYMRAGYVHQYYLGWPSLGSKNSKNIIPSQFTFDLGFNYTLPKKWITIAFDASNLFNAQVYDNFLLQKPGRAFSVKLSFVISNVN